jgi:hypothetical protein
MIQIYFLLITAAVLGATKKVPIKESVNSGNEKPRNYPNLENHTGKKNVVRKKR